MLHIMLLLLRTTFASGFCSIPCLVFPKQWKCLSSEYIACTEFVCFDWFYLVITLLFFHIMAYCANFENPVHHWCLCCLILVFILSVIDEFRPTQFRPGGTHLWFQALGRLKREHWKFEANLGNCEGTVLNKNEQKPQRWFLYYI